jgi:glycerol uptake facilitator-like aquaporin
MLNSPRDRLFTSLYPDRSPAVTIARGLPDTFSGLAPAGIPGFIVAQLLGALAATLLSRWIGNGK